MNKLLHQPIKPLRISQRFGENLACVSLDGLNRIIACDGKNPPSGYKSLYGDRGHLGIDIPAYHGQEVYAAQRGRIYKVDTNLKSGLDVRVESEEDGHRFRHIYEHLLGYQGKVGDWVETGQLIGWADNTGYSGGDHLHFQVEMYVNGVWQPIDPLPIMSDYFAKDVLLWNSKLKYLAEQLALLADRLGDYIRNKSRN